MRFFNTFFDWLLGLVVRIYPDGRRQPERNPDETYLPTFDRTPQTHAWFSRPHENQGGP